MFRTTNPSISLLADELSAWETNRNAAQKDVDWQFTADDARIKLNAFTHNLRIDRVLDIQSNFRCLHVTWQLFIASQFFDDWINNLQRLFA